MVRKWLLYIAGVLSLVAGIVGVFLPIWPTTPFLLLASWCLVRSSPKLHNWVYNHSVLGGPLMDWEKRGVIRRKSKVLAVSMILISGVVAWVKIEWLYLKFSLIILLGAVVTFLVSRPEK